MPEPSGTTTTPQPTLRQALSAPGVLKLLAVSGLLGIPISLLAFWFVGLEHQLQHWVWESAPEQLGFDRAPWWWGLPALTLAGLLAAPIITRMRGAGGHTPVHGLGGPPTPPGDLPSVVLAALVCLPLGVMLGPEAPLMALGGGLALLAIRSAQRAAAPQATAVLGAAGSTAAISTIFGSPLVAAVMMIEAAGMGGVRLMVLILPCLLASGIGALVFTGFGHWTGLGIGSLALSSEPPAGLPDAADFLWGVPLAVLVAVLITAGRRLGFRTESWVHGSRPALRVVVCAVAVGACITLYALSTGRSPQEAALSGQATLSQLAAGPHAWAVGALIALIAFKVLGWGVALGSLRGGPIFPAVMIGAAAGVACGGLPGLGMASGLAAGICAASTAVTRLPVTSVVLATALLGKEANDLMPLLIVSAVVALLTSAALNKNE